MKSFFATVLFLVVGIQTQAAETCYEFDVAAHSEKLKILQVTVSFVSSSSQRAKATLRAHSTPSRSTKTPFQCQRFSVKLVCTQLDGGGDFTLIKRANGASLEFTYINLLIGSTEGVVLPKDGEIDEEFALVDQKGNAGDDEEDEHDGELPPVRIFGQEVPCAKFGSASPANSSQNPN